MGDCGQYNAGVQARYKRNLNQKEANTDEQIDKFLETKGKSYSRFVECEYEDITQENIESGKFLGFIVENKWEEEWDSRNETLEDFFNEFDDYDEDFWRVTNAILPVNKEDLRNVNLFILAEYKDYPASVDKVVQLASVYESIYCENDNSSSDNVTLSADTIQAIVDGKCTLELYGDGSGNC